MVSKKKKKRSSPKLRLIFWPKSQIQMFFPPIKKNKRSSPKLRLIFRPKSQIQTFFFAKNQVVSKNKNKKRSSPKLRHIFRPNSEIQTFEGGLFSYGGVIFNFSQKIGLKTTKNVRFCILHKPMGGLGPPRPPPGYATVYY